jgi:hypothetical protein
MSRAVLTSLALCCLLAALGCPPDDANQDDGLLETNGWRPIEAVNGRPGDRHSEASWPFWPRSMRVHPATRIAIDRESSQPMLETRIEFADQHGAITKACGQLTVELRDAASPLRADSAAAGTWNIDLRDLAKNREHFDDITRTYLLRLKLEGMEVPAQPRITVYFLSSDGTKLTAEHDPRRQG